MACDGQGGERRFFRGLPDDGVAADEREGGVPAQTATGKLKAEMTPTTPSGCQVSIMRWSGRSEATVRPASWRERPAAKSQMSIISWTSPRPSERILPASMVTRRPRSVDVGAQLFAEEPDEFAAFGGGDAAPLEECDVGLGDGFAGGSGVMVWTWAMTSPVMGVRTVWLPLVMGPTPSSARRVWTCF